jgi:hypothetical protein
VGFQGLLKLIKLGNVKTENVLFIRAADYACTVPALRACPNPTFPLFIASLLIHECLHILTIINQIF